jgi:hypothetical protein
MYLSFTQNTLKFITPCCEISLPALLLYKRVALIINMNSNVDFLHKTIRHSIGATDRMSQAFVKEGDEQWLGDIDPTIKALVNYLTRENNGIRVYEQKQFVDPKTGKEVYVMSNGLSYSKDIDGRWEIVGI